MMKIVFIAAAKIISMALEKSPSSKNGIPKTYTQISSIIATAVLKVINLKNSEIIL